MAAPPGPKTRGRCRAVVVRGLPADHAARHGVRMVRVSVGRLVAGAFSREAKSRPSMTSPNSWKDTSPAAVIPLTGVLTRPIAMFPKLPTAAVPVRAGWVFQVAVSLQVVPGRQIAGPLVVALDTWTPRLAAVIDSPAARAATVNFR